MLLVSSEKGNVIYDIPSQLDSPLRCSWLMLVRNSDLDRLAYSRLAPKQSMTSERRFSAGLKLAVRPAVQLGYTGCAQKGPNANQRHCLYSGYGLSLPKFFFPFLESVKSNLPWLLARAFFVLVHVWQPRTPMTSAHKYGALNRRKNLTIKLLQRSILYLYNSNSLRYGLIFENGYLRVLVRWSWKVRWCFLRVQWIPAVFLPRRASSIILLLPLAGKLVIWRIKLAFSC